MNVMRSMLLVGLMFGSMAFAQSSAEEAYARCGLVTHNISLWDDMTIDLQGTITEGSTSYPININGYITKEVVGSNLVTKFDLRTFADGQKVQQFVGDGSHLWLYDVRTNTYRTVKYGRSEASNPLNLSKAFQGMSRGITPQVARILLDAYDPTRQNTWRPFQPLATWDSALYFKWGLGALQETFNYDCNTGVDVDDPSDDELTQFSYSKDEVIRGIAKNTSFQVTFTRILPNDPDLGLFELKLPASARPVANSKG